MRSGRPSLSATSSRLHPYHSVFAVVSFDAVDQLSRALSQRVVDGLLKSAAIIRHDEREKPLVVFTPLVSRRAVNRKHLVGHELQGVGAQVPLPVADVGEPPSASRRCASFFVSLSASRRRPMP